MNIELQRLRALAPVAVFTALLIVGWVLVVRPVMSARTTSAREVDQLRQRLLEVRASLSDPHSAISADAPRSFEHAMAAGDPSSRVFQELAALAKSAKAVSLLIETGDRVTAASPDGPQVSAGAAMPDPRLALFDVQVAYSPIAMSFDASFADVGQFFWLLRDLATIVEVREVTLTPVPDEARVHVALTLFAYARVASAAAAGALQ